MISLKRYTPILADYLDLTSDALYERQRVLVRLNLLEAPSGRGPGSGIRATPSAVSQIIVAVLATDSLSEIDLKARGLGNGRAENKVCPLTGRNDFLGALESILTSEVLAKKVTSIEVERSTLKATIYFNQKGRRYPGLSNFGIRPIKFGSHRFSVMANLPAQAVQEICAQLKDIAADYPTKALFEQFEATLALRRILVKK
jgi:hypothetical protein